MAQRLGISTREEFHMRRAIMAGQSWDKIVRELDDVNRDYVFENVYKPLKAAFDGGEDLMSAYGRTGMPTPGDIAKATEAVSGPPPGEKDPALDVELPKPPEGTKPL